MNKGGQTLFIAILVGVMIFIAGMVFMNYLGPEITNARAATALDCSNPAISDGNKLACLGVDLVVPYFIIIVISAAGGLITAKFLL